MHFNALIKVNPFSRNNFSDVIKVTLSKYLSKSFLLTRGGADVGDTECGERLRINRV